MIVTLPLKYCTLAKSPFGHVNHLNKVCAIFEIPKIIFSVGTWPVLLSIGDWQPVTENHKIIPYKCWNFIYSIIKGQCNQTLCY